MFISEEKYKTENEIINDENLTDKEKIELLKKLNNKNNYTTIEEKEDSKNILLG